MDIFLMLSGWLLAVIPDISLPLDVGSYMQPVSNVIGYVDTFVSLPILALCISAVLLVDNWTRIVRLSVKLWELLPFT